MIWAWRKEMEDGLIRLKGTSRRRDRTPRPAKAANEVAFGEGEEGMMDLWKWMGTQGRDAPESFYRGAQLGAPRQRVPQAASLCRRPCGGAARASWLCRGLAQRGKQTEDAGRNRALRTHFQRSLCLPHLARIAEWSLRCAKLLAEAEELFAIFAASAKTSRGR